MAKGSGSDWNGKGKRSGERSGNSARGRRSNYEKRNEGTYVDEEGYVQLSDNAEPLPWF